MKKTKIISKNRKKFYLKLHLVLVTKYRKKIFNLTLKKFLYDSINSMSDNYEFSIEKINGTCDHVHLLISYSPDIKINSIVMLIKQITTNKIWNRYPNILSNHFFKKKVLWSDGYFVSSIGYTDETNLKKYIDSQ